MSAEDDRRQREWVRAVDAMTLEECLETVARAWRHRRRRCAHWRLIATNVTSVRQCHMSESATHRADEAWLRCQLEGLGKGDA